MNYRIQVYGVTFVRMHFCISALPEIYRCHDEYSTHQVDGVDYVG